MNGYRSVLSGLVFVGFFGLMGALGIASSFGRSIWAAGGRDAVVSALAAQSVVSQVYQGKYYYGFKGKRVELTESLDTIGVTFEDELTGNVANSIVTSLELYSGLLDLSPNATFGPENPLRVKVLPMVPDEAETAIQNAIDHQAIKQVHRVYRMGTEWVPKTNP